MEPPFSNKITETDGRICLQNRLLKIAEFMSLLPYKLILWASRCCMMVINKDYIMNHTQIIHHVKLYGIW